MQYMATNVYIANLKTKIDNLYTDSDNTSPKLRHLLDVFKISYVPILNFVSEELCSYCSFRVKTLSLLSSGYKIVVAIISLRNTGNDWLVDHHSYSCDYVRKHN